jgi:hypothetical protein
MADITPGNLIHGKDEYNQEGHGLNFMQGDGIATAKYFLIGGSLFAGYQMFVSLFRRNANPSSELKDKTSVAFNNDTLIRNSFIDLQKLRHLDIKHFSSAIRNTDRLLFLEAMLRRGDNNVIPKRSDKDKGWSYFQAVVYNLHSFQIAVLETMGEEYFIAVKIYCDKIRGQLRIHFTNILNCISNFRPETLLHRADSLIKELEEHKVKKNSKSRNDVLKKYGSSSCIRKS